MVAKHAWRKQGRGGAGGRRQPLRGSDVPSGVRLPASGGFGRSTGRKPPPGVLSLTPASADLGSAQVGSPVAAVVFTAQNTGGQAFTVSNVSIGGSGASQFGVTVNGCLNRVLAPSASCQITVGATPTQVLVSNATLTATGSSGQSDSSTLRVEGTLKLFNPTLVMNPGVARPGQVTTAIGAGFPPGAVVQLAVAGGLPFATVTADANGDLRGSLLILRNSPLVGGFEVISVSGSDGFTSQV